MRITVLGIGNIGRTLGTKWANAGHDVMFGVREPQSPKVQAFLETLEGKASADALGPAIARAQLVLFAIPWSAVPGAVEAHGDALNGKIVIDATNNFAGPVINNLATIAVRAPSAILFRAFNNLGWENLQDPLVGGVQADLLFCGPENEACDAVEDLIRDVGLRPVWVGDLNQAPLVDAVGLLWVALAMRREMGRRLAFKVLMP